MSKKTVLIIGSMGRDHALGWKLKQSPKVGKIYFAPGNAGTEYIGINTGLEVLDTDSLVKFALKHKIDLAVSGQDDALAQGLVDAFQKKGLVIFGPTKKASQIEWSKAFAKQLMIDEKIPTAAYKTFTDATDAKKYLKKQKFPIVIKASGLALGKGVTIVKSLDEALRKVDEIMIKKTFGDAGSEIVIEEFLKGVEISIHVFTDGETISLFPSARDHKPIFDGNKGPNTGGMGTIAPVAGITQKDMELIKKTIVLPALSGLKKRGMPFAGCLYPGLMITKNGPKVIEFNSRFGDPELESYMRLLKTDLYDILLACASGTLAKINIKWEKQFACCIVLASSGYPKGSHKGDVIYGLTSTALQKNIQVFHFATKRVNGKIVTNGGRVLGVTAVGKTLNRALKSAYSAIGDKGIHFANMQYRLDIGKIL